MILENLQKGILLVDTLAIRENEKEKNTEKKRRIRENEK